MWGGELQNGRRWGVGTATESRGGKFSHAEEGGGGGGWWIYTTSLGVVLTQKFEALAKLEGGRKQFYAIFSREVHTVSKP